jgi:hypothetical protein
LEAHERWQYDDTEKVQKLMRLVALCNKCHQSTHFGLASLLGKSEEATQHLKQERGFTDGQVELHINDAFSLYRERSKHNWKLDITLITSNGIKLSDNIGRNMAGSPGVASSRGAANRLGANSIDGANDKGVEQKTSTVSDWIEYLHKMISDLLGKRW